MSEFVELGEMTVDHAAAVLAVYREGIETGNATFVSEVPDWAAFDTTRLPQGRLVALLEGKLVGWTSLTRVSPRPVYRGLAEISVYVTGSARGMGIGRRLLEAAIPISEAAGVWTLTAGMFPENTASVGLHQACGFRILGVQERVGRMEHGPFAGRWRDVVRLERRSTVVGLD